MDDSQQTVVDLLQNMTDDEFQAALMYDGDDVYVVLNDITYIINKNPE